MKDVVLHALEQQEPGARHALRVIEVVHPARAGDREALAQHERHVLH